MGRGKVDRNLFGVISTRSLSVHFNVYFSLFFSLKKRRHHLSFEVI